jgi:glyceraldehyde-3-phosphate dehydrogenase (NAD(P))
MRFGTKMLGGDSSMTRVRVGVLGYGVIGKRVADAVRLQCDMEVTGVAGPPGSPSLQVAHALGYAVYLGVPDRSIQEMPQHVAGTLRDLLGQIDVLLDCTPSGVPALYQPLYDTYPGLPVIVQGGEKHSFGGVSFNSFANYGEVLGCKRVRVISCSSTGSTRVVWALHRAFGLEQGFLSLWRRAADPGKPSKTPLNALTPVMGQSHHAPDIETVLPGLHLYSMSADCLTTLGHVVTLQADLRRPTTRVEIIAMLERMPRIIIGSGLVSTADLAEYYQDLGRPRRDRPEVYVWAEGLCTEGRTVVVTFSIHMESITIPETVDCVRGMIGLERDGWASIRRTDIALGIAKQSACYPPFTA